MLYLSFLLAYLDTSFSLLGIGIGLILIFFGLFIKLGLAPFHY
jgi:NADH:ubiquinone oxidoreductase subunit 2 (subunit N)